MSERLPQTANPFSSMTSAMLIGVGTVLFVAIFALLAWSPDLANKNRAGLHPYSESALGYAGLVRLLEADGQTVTVSRLSSTLDYNDGLLILALPGFGLNRASEFDLESIAEPALYVLPKWTGFADREKPSWQKDTELLRRETVEFTAHLFDPEAKVWRLRNPGVLQTPFGAHTPKFEHEMQVLESNRLVPIVETPGGTLLGMIPDTSIYILSDPDVLNTFGLMRRENASFALSMIDWLKEYSDQTVTLDATIHGFERSESLLRAIFDIPFLGATLIAFATILLVAWGAFIRFGPPLPEDRALSFGKKALAESSAGLISMARREGQMAPGYAQVIKRNLTKRLGLPPQTKDDAFAQTADRLSEQNGLSSTWSEQSQGLAAPAAGRNELRDKARALWRWRQEMKDGH